MSLRSKILGHERVLEGLSARQDRLPNLMIFAGPSGIGKKMVALILSQDLICPKGPPACGVCGTCIRIQDEKSESVLMIAPETAQGQIKLDQSRQIEQFLQLRQIQKARTIIIDQAHRLNHQASNALLKIFEEPPANSYFFLVTQNPNSLLATIRSRAQAFRFAPLSDAQIQALTGAENWMLKLARGQLDLISRMKENTKAWTDSQAQALHFFELALKHEGNLFSKIKDIAGDKETSLQNILVWQSLLRDALVLKLGSNDILNAAHLGLVQSLAKFESEFLSQISGQLLQMEQDLSAHVDRTLLLENFYFKVSGQHSKSGGL
jgi:DNA polymerase-3 subunit delta'